MKKTDANVILKEELKKEVERKVSPYATNAMRPAIIGKSIEGRKKAIDKDFCSEYGVSAERLQEWSYNTDSLYEAAVAYSKAIGKDDEDQAMQECLRIWKLIIKVGEEDIFHPNMYIREKDVENFRVLAAESTYTHIPSKGFVATTRGKNAFRGIVETMLALRIAGNATLNDTDRQTVEDYKKATKVIKQANDLLNGYVDSQGNRIPSLYDQIEQAQADLDEFRAMKGRKGDKKADNVEKRLENIANDLNKQADNAEKRLEKYFKVEKDLRGNYNEIVNRLDAIEGVSEKKADVATSRADRRAALAAKFAAYQEATK